MEEQTNTTNTTRRAKQARRIYAALAAVIFIVAAVTITKLISNQSAEKHEAARIAQVRITQSGFNPSTLVVKKGTKIVWTNTDNSLHQVTANPYPTGKDLPGLKSEILNNTQTYTYIANTAGSFGYHDQMKPTVNGTIVIQK